MNSCVTTCWMRGNSLTPRFRRSGRINSAFPSEDRFKKDKTFFFANYEGFRWRRQITLIGTLPSAQQLSGEFLGIGAGSGSFDRRALP